MIPDPDDETERRWAGWVEGWKARFAADHPGQPVPEPSHHDVLDWMSADWTTDNVAHFLQHVWNELGPVKRVVMQAELERLLKDAEEGRTIPGRLQ